MNSNLLGMLGLARRGGMLSVGEEPTLEAAQQKRARLLLLASDAADNTERRIRRFAESGSCLWIRVPFTKAELGSEVGRASCAILAVTDIGLAAAIAHRLADKDAALYGETAAKLDLKAKRAAERKSERRSPEKKRTGASQKEEEHHSLEKKRTRVPRKEEERHSLEKKRTRVPRKEAEQAEKNESAPVKRGISGNFSREKSSHAFHSGSRRPGGGEHAFHHSEGKRKFSHFSAHSSSAGSGRSFTHSKPVKKGKGSFRKKSEGK